MSESNNAKKGDFNETVAALWPTASGNGFKSTVLGAKEYDAIQKMELGGRIFIRENKKKGRSETDPHFYLEYMPKEKVEAFAKQSKGYGNRSRQSSSNDVI